MMRLINSRLVLSFVGIVAAVLFVLPPQAFAVSYGSGVYTNLCGTGTAATANTCKAGCDTNSGICKGNTNSVVRFTCSGKQTECRQNETVFSTSQSISNNVPCDTTVQIDVFSKQCRSGNGAWTCGDTDLKDYMVWYSGSCAAATPAPTATPKPTPAPTPNNSCGAQQPVDTQFRRSGQTTWVSGSTITNAGLTPNTQIDVNCFAKNGSALLPGATIDITYPTGVTVVSSGPELRNFVLPQAGNYSFRCSSATIASCSNTDTLTVANSTAISNGVGGANAVTSDPHESSCDDLTVASGNRSTVPAKVTLRARASDNKGNIQRYKFYFGDGSTQETDQLEVQHTYESSGSFVARVDVKDSQGNWKTSSRCEDTVRVDSSPVESHKSDCSDVFITTTNGAQAPTTMGFRVTGFDNKGSLQQYRMDFGNGIVKDSSGETFEQRYETAGTYTVKGYVKDSQGNWQGGDDSCKRTVYIGTKPLTEQPKTGTPTMLSLAGASSGVIGVALQFIKRKLNK